MLILQEMSAAEAGITTERQIQIALRTMVNQGGEATSSQIYEEIERNMPTAGIKLSQQGRDTLRGIISREAVRHGYVAPYDSSNPGWRITPLGRDYLFTTEESLGTEVEETISNDPDPNVAFLTDPVITKPFDPSTINVDQRMMTIYQVMRKLRLKDIELQPEFQRNIVWDATRQSRLIESILLGIPLPAFYLDATHDDKWLVVDGLQRLATLDGFYNKHSLVLRNLEFLTSLNGLGFPSLSRSLQRAIEDTELNLYVIRPETPPQVKFTIFSRVNTAGLVLTPQEIRHALYQGPATRFISELAKLPEFITATTGSISPLRMDDRECVLRFLAFYLTDYKIYGRTEQKHTNGRSLQQNLDGFLSDAMEHLNETTEAEFAHLRSEFRQSMIRAEAVFGAYAFRKLYQYSDRRTQISKPLFESWSVMLTRYSLASLIQAKDKIIDGFIALMQNIEFNRAISLGTGSIRSVRTRFQSVEALLEATVI